MTVWIAQCLCGPQRHAILANAGVADDRADAEDSLLKPLQAHVGEMLRTGVFNPWCGLCRAPADTWRYEVRRTRFRSMQEATPVLEQSEREQAVVRAIAAGKI